MPESEALLQLLANCLQVTSLPMVIFKNNKVNGNSQLWLPQSITHKNTEKKCSQLKTGGAVVLFFCLVFPKCFPKYINWSKESSLISIPTKFKEGSFLGGQFSIHLWRVLPAFCRRLQEFFDNFQLKEGFLTHILNNSRHAISSYFFIWPQFTGNFYKVKTHVRNTKILINDNFSQI